MAGPELHLLFNLGAIIATGAVCAFLGKVIRMPSIVAYLAAGMLLGPALGLVEIDHSLELISKLGIALLLFLVGLELSFEKIRDVGKVAFYAGIGQVVFTALFGFLLCLALGFAPVPALFLAVALTFSSTVVVVKLLDQKGELDHLYGRIAVGIFLVQDIVVIAVLTILTGLQGAGAGFDPASIALSLARAGGGMVLLLGLTLLAAKYLLPRPFAWAARSPDTSFVWALSWCLLIAGLASALGLSIEIGAFLAGIAVAQLPYNSDLHRRLHPLMTLFVAVFFVTLGVRMDFSAAHESWSAAAILALFVLIGNPLIFMIIIARMGYSEGTAFRTSVTVAQISEFSFIFAAMGVSAGLVGDDTISIVALVGIVTIAASAYMIIYTEPLYRTLKRIGALKCFRAKQQADTDAYRARRGHIIVVGMNALGREIVSQLCRRGERVLAIDTDPAKLDGLGAADTLIGNVEYESVVEEVGLREAKLVVSALQIEDTNHLLAYRCRACGVPCAIHAFDVSVVDDLLELDTSYLLMPTVDGIVEQRRLLDTIGLDRPQATTEP